MGHETRGRRTVPVVLCRLEEHAIAGADHLDVTASMPDTAHALSNVDRLPVRVLVPRRPCAGREVHAGCVDARTLAGYRNLIDVDRACEPVARSRPGRLAVSRDLHAFSLWRDADHDTGKGPGGENCP